MKRAPVAALVLLTLPACFDSTEPRVPTSIALSPAALAFDAVGASRKVAATVLDQDGDPMKGVALEWSSSSAALSVVGAAGDSATVTAVANGEATITVIGESATATLSATVAQRPDAGAKAAGDAQVGAAGGALPTPVRVRVADRLGAPVAGVAVGFAVTRGGGTLSEPTTTTGADGSASTVWTVGTVAGAPNELLATIDGVTEPLLFTATVTAGAPAAIEVVAGADQTATVGTAVAPSPSVRVRDGFGNPVAGVTVDFAVTGGGGALGGSAQVTDAEGVATVDRWVLGAPGANTLTATVRGTSVPGVVVTATGVAAGDAVVLSVHAGDDQAAMAGTAVPTPPAVIARDEAGNPRAGESVTFVVTAGGGSVVGATAVTDAGGVATLGSWTLGPVAELNSLRVTAVGARDPVTIEAAGCSTSPGPSFGITLCVSSPLSSANRASFESALSRWQSIVTGDLPDVPVRWAAGQCDARSKSIDLVVDDLLIFAAIETIDGPGAVLGAAGPCMIRDAASGRLPVVGVMRFDVADISRLSASQREALLLHEMGHVLGIGTLWPTFGLLQNRSFLSPVDTHYSGTHGIAGFDAIGGTSYTLGLKVPVENTGGGGTANSHWRESVLANELMTGFLEQFGAMPLSQLTVRSLLDLGYQVDVSRADPFSLALSMQAYRTRGPGAIPLHDDIYTGPLHTVDASGRTRRIR